MSFSEEVLAKSNPQETLEEHTRLLHDSFRSLCNSGYLKADVLTKFSPLIEKMIHYHDMGKLSRKFQIKLRKSQKQLQTPESKEILNLEEWPHEWLSLAFISKEDKKLFESVNADGLNFYDLARFCIAYHHTRSSQRYDSYDIRQLKQHVEYDLEHRKHLLGISHDLRKNYDIRDIRTKINGKTGDNDTFNRYLPHRVFFKGLLHKCDYTASAHIEPEKQYGTFRQDFESWLAAQSFSLRPFQENAKTLSDKSIVLVASTGMGKTEFAMNWINGDKAFYLLGIRMAVNAMYERFSKVFDAQSICLLHGDSGTMLLDEEDTKTIDDYTTKQSKARNLSYPITIATADQLVPAVFKYNGFELIYFTCSYSKIVVDEIQSFSPKSIAAIVVFLKEIHRLGGRFLLMTATLPQFIKEELKEISTFLPPALLEKRRHVIEIKQDAIESEETIQHILREGSQKSILVICNTVKKAQLVYQKLAEENPEHTALLHARFIGRDKKLKEAHIMKDAASDVRNKIWVTTQVVEASLDIDFDLLFTEMATIDSLFQRFGRCYRNRDYLTDQPNIYIFNSPTEKYSIYDPQLLDATQNHLANYNGQLLTEETKQLIIDAVFSDLSETSNYMKAFSDRKKLLELGFQADKSEAQKAFREITNSFVLIPAPVYQTNRAIIHQLITDIDSKTCDRLERIRKVSELKSYTVAVQLYGRQQDENIRDLDFASAYCKKNSLKILNGCAYAFETGVVMDPKLAQAQSLENRMI